MYHIIGYQTNPITGETQYQILCDTVADLPTSPVSDNGYGGEIGQGSKAVIIADGNSYIADSNRQWIYQPNPNAWVNVYTKLEIDEMITEIYETIAYYHTALVSDTGEITFYAFAGYIGTWTIFGNGQQTGTPTPDNPIQPDFVGKKVGADWTIPITCAGQTVPVYLGQTQTVRRIKKRVLTGMETIGWYNNRCVIKIDDGIGASSVITVWCSHYSPTLESMTNMPNYTIKQINTKYWTSSGDPALTINDTGSTYSGSSVFADYLASEYSAGHPVEVWYVLAEPETTIVNEPLAKIGDYADELHSADAGVAIPTVKGENTLTVDTILKPGRIEIQG